MCAWLALSGGGALCRHFRCSHPHQQTVYFQNIHKFCWCNKIVNFSPINLKIKFLVIVWTVIMWEKAQALPQAVGHWPKTKRYVLCQWMTTSKAIGWHLRQTNKKITCMPYGGEKGISVEHDSESQRDKIMLSSRQLSVTATWYTYDLRVRKWRILKWCTSYGYRSSIASGTHDTRASIRLQTTIKLSRIFECPQQLWPSLWMPRMNETISIENKHK